MKITKILNLIIGIAISLVLVTSISYADSGIVVCGAGSDLAKACKMDDIFKQANNLAGFIIKILFPIVFFFGLFMVAWPLVNQFGEPSANVMALVKSRAKKLVLGTIFVVGSFLIVRAILVGLGYTGSDTIDNPVNTNTGFLTPSAFFETAIAADPTGFLPNPLEDVSVQKATLGIANVFAYIVIVASILGVVRGVMYLMLTQENPDNLRKGKVWILRSLGAGALILGAQLIYSILSNTISSVFG